MDRNYSPLWSIKRKTPKKEERIKMPQTYTAYINSIEDSNYSACYEHRKSMNLPVDFDLLTIECETAPCKIGCPFD